MMPEVDKKKLKNVFLRKRKYLSEDEYDKRNAKLFYQFSQLIETLKPNNTHVFIPILKNKEVNTWVMIKYLKAIGVDIIISRMLPETNGLEHFLYENARQLKENKWGIMEPQYGNSVSVDQLELILVPLIIFDRAGHRVGYGKGYYDKFMSQCKPSCIKVGLSLLPPVDAIPYTESHDIALDYCISPLNIHKFQNQSI